MIVGDVRLGRHDFEALAVLHRNNLEKSIVSNLGQGFLTRYYEFVARCDSEFIFVEGVSGDIHGAAVLSFDSRSVMFSFVKQNMLAFMAAALWKCLISPSFVRVLWQQRSPDSASVGDNNSEQIEIVQIFVNEKHRNQSIGTKLLVQVNDFLHSKSIDHYVIRTRLYENEATLGFYKKNGFIEFKRAEWKDAIFVFMKKAVLPPAADNDS